MFEPSVWMRAVRGARRQASRDRCLTRGIRLAVLTVGLALVSPTASWADFMWMDNQWNVNKFDVTIGPATAQTTFGDVTADLANSGGSMTAISDPNTVNSGGFLMVTFMRQFKLLNDPYGSEVTLFGILSGALNATSGAAIMADASGSGMAEIVESPLIFIFALDTALANNSTDDKFVMQPESRSGILSDGIYTVSGSLMVEVNVMQGQMAIANANADLSWIVGISAVPVPEPATLLQVGAGCSVLLFWARRHRMRAAAARRLI
jgi:hypothetical protein